MFFEKVRDLLLAMYKVDVDMSRSMIWQKVKRKRTSGFFRSVPSTKEVCYVFSCLPLCDVTITQRLRTARFCCVPPHCRRLLLMHTLWLLIQTKLGRFVVVCKIYLSSLGLGGFERTNLIHKARPENLTVCR